MLGGLSAPKHFLHQPVPQGSFELGVGWLCLQGSRVELSGSWGWTVARAVLGAVLLGQPEAVGRSGPGALLGATCEERDPWHPPPLPRKLPVLRAVLGDKLGPWLAVPFL